MNNNKWLLVLEDDLNNKGEKKYIELNNDVDEFTLRENILMDLYENYNIDITCEEYLSKNIPKDIYKRRIMNIDEIGFIIRGKCVEKLDELFLLAPFNEGSHNIFCYMVYIMEIYKDLTLKKIKEPILQVLLNKLFGLKILSKNDKTSRMIVASEYFSDYTCKASIKELIKQSNNFKDNLKVNQRNKEEDIKMISEIIHIKK